jgi:ribonuclease E
MKCEMLINARQPEESRIAIVEDGVLEELYIERAGAGNYVGNIYKGRVVNIESSIQAAFVDFGVGRNGFLHISDVEPHYFRQAGFTLEEIYAHGQEGDDDVDGDSGHPVRGPQKGPKPGARPRFKPPIQDVFRKGDEVFVQVIKEGMGTKGPTLSTYVSIPGRYLVLMPSLGRVGVSRKIEDVALRRRLRDTLLELEPPKGLGFIIRTAGVERTKKDLARDLSYLLRLWRVIVRRVKKYPAPIDIYEESDMITRTIRDIFTADIDTIWVDEPNAYTRAKEFLELVMPKYADRLRLYDKPEPIFSRYNIEQEIARIHQREVPLPKGGSIVIDQTEALVAIDVNSGNFRTEGENAEETAYQMNLLAAKEIARQLRLRDLGGVVVNDFIDMRRDRHRRGVEKALRDAVERDRARTKILRTSPFGLIEMTRQRIRPSLKRSVYKDCPCCKGTGLVKTAESMAIEVLRTLGGICSDKKLSRVVVHVADEVQTFLNNNKRRDIAGLEAEGGLSIQILGIAHVTPEHLMIECWDDIGKEVKVNW